MLIASHAYTLTSLRSAQVSAQLQSCRLREVRHGMAWWVAAPEPNLPQLQLETAVRFLPLCIGMEWAGVKTASWKCRVFPNHRGGKEIGQRIAGWWLQPQWHKAGDGDKERFPADCKTYVTLTEDVIFFHTSWCDARDSPGPTRSLSWWAHDTYTSNNQKVIPSICSDWQTGRIYLQGRNSSDIITAALRDWCGEVLGRFAQHWCRKSSGQRRNKPVFSIFLFLYFPRSPFRWGLLL